MQYACTNFCISNYKNEKNKYDSCRSLFSSKYNLLFDIWIPNLCYKFKNIVTSVYNYGI